MRYWKPKKITKDWCPGFVVATYEQALQLPCLVASLKSQTYQRFKVLLAHDGPATEATRRAALVAVDGDPRFTWTETGARADRFGHNMRGPGLRWLSQQGCQILGTCNGDGYYAPVYLEWLVWMLEATGAQLAYCDLIHSHKLWKPMRTALRRGQIDCCCWLARDTLALKHPWDNLTFAGDWHFLEKMLRGQPRVAKVEAYLACHN
jgi:hypothetical protein